jgi:hypothetical protein
MAMLNVPLRDNPAAVIAGADPATCKHEHVRDIETLGMAVTRFCLDCGATL